MLFQHTQKNVEHSGSSYVDVGMLCVYDVKVESAAELRSCRNPGLNRGPLDLQSNALPTELFRLTKMTICDINSEHVLDKCIDKNE